MRAGSEFGLPELGKAGLSRTRQALGEGAQRDRTQLGGRRWGDGDKRVIRDSGATVIWTAGAPEITSRDRVMASQWRPCPPSPALGSRGSPRPLSPPSQQIPLPPRGSGNPRVRLGPRAPPRILIFCLCCPAQRGGGGGGTEQVLRGLFFIINDNLCPHAKSCNPA